MKSTVFFLHLFLFYSYCEYLRYHCPLAEVSINTAISLYFWYHPFCKCCLHHCNSNDNTANYEMISVRTIPYLFTFFFSTVSILALLPQLWYFLRHANIATAKRIVPELSPPLLTLMCCTMPLYSLSWVSIPATIPLYPSSLQRYQFHHPCNAIVSISISLHHTDIPISMRLYRHFCTHVTNPISVLGSAIFPYDLHILICLLRIDERHSDI